MKNRHTQMSISFLLLILLGLFTACSSINQSNEPDKLKIAVLPILDALPMYVAQENGYFEEQAVEVEFIPVGSAAERDQVIASGQADGMINDLVSTLLYNQDTIHIQIVSFARTATPDFPQFRILAAKDSGITSVEQLKGVEIGISEGSVIEYTTDRFLEAEGFSSLEIATLAVPSIPVRMSLLDSGELKAANLPDPLASLAIQGGAVVIIDDTSYPEYGNSLISFRKSVIDSNPDAISGFLTAIKKAALEINADPTKWDTLLTEQKLVPAPLIGSYQIPTFPIGSLPSQAQWEDVVQWGMDKGFISHNVSYDASVNGEFLP
ncbi:MAG TPA: MetQ/NlpA family ABC transporter substrate-binding protein [Anaerolineales bacterium]|nr:MetQ/NlpA family ABC transporter substrate-binding protein [Anaerolineales bacterium]